MESSQNTMATHPHVWGGCYVVLLPRRLLTHHLLLNQRRVSKGYPKCLAINISLLFLFRSYLQTQSMRNLRANGKKCHLCPANGPRSRLPYLTAKSMSSVDSPKRELLIRLRFGTPRVGGGLYSLPYLFPFTTQRSLLSMENYT